MVKKQQFQIVMHMVLVIALMGAASSGTYAKDKKVANYGNVSVDISNFGKVNDHYYRGACPKDGQYEELAAIGVKTVIDLRDDAKKDAQLMAEHAGLRYINFPLDDKHYPAQQTAERFLQLVNDQANWPVFVHCEGGRHRTGAMTAVYRMTMDGWDIDRAYREMKDYDFYTSWGHAAWKDFVYDFYRGIEEHRFSALTSTHLITTNISMPALK